MRLGWLTLLGLVCLGEYGLASAPEPAPRYDLLIRGGHVIDPRNGIDGIRDVAVWGGRIARRPED